MKPPKQSRYKIKLISIYVTIAVTGVILILVAIYHASMELEIIHDTNNMYDIFSDRIKDEYQAITKNITSEKLDGFARSLSTEKYHIVALHDEAFKPINTKHCGMYITQQVLIESKINQRGGFISDGDCTYNWALIPVAKNGSRLLVLHQFSPRGMKSLFFVYTNRLIIPIAFFIWMTVWGSLILGNLVNRLQQQKEKVEHMAMHDALTGLPNRNLFSEQLKEILSYSRRKNEPFTLALIDLDKFKSVNDDYGHNYGDELLRQVAQRFNDITRDYDIVARIGGDEFILLIPYTNAALSKDILNRIYDSLIQAYSIFNHSVHIGASIGVAYFPEHAADITDLTHKADSAMYVAKESGGGIQVFERDMRV